MNKKKATDLKGGRKQFDLETDRIVSLEDLLTAFEVDLSVWEVERFTINKWEVGAKHPDTGKIVTSPLVQCKAILKQIAPNNFFKTALKEFKAKAKKYAPEYPLRTRKLKAKGRLAILSIYDLHVGKLAWAPETGGRNYDTKEAISRFKKASYDLIGEAIPFGIEEVWIPLGNDLINIDNIKNETTHGTPQDVDSRWQYMLRKTKEAYVEIIEYLVYTCEVKVTIIWVPGNHDELFSMLISEWLEAWFRSCAHVEFRNEPKHTKVLTYYSNMFIFNHF